MDPDTQDTPQPPGQDSDLGAAEAAFEAGQWAQALRGFERARDSLQGETPRDVLAMGSMCLHRLKRYHDAESWALEGLGDQRALLAVGEPLTEAQHFARWGGNRVPVVSIVCTTFNHERYIETAIRGFLSQQTSFPFEILIHDDASTDGSQEIITRWQGRYPRIMRTVLQSENQFSRGVRPFELLLAQARGAYVATCEGDDFWIDASKLQRQVSFLHAHPEFSCSAHNYYHYDESALSVTPWLKKPRDRVLSARELMAIKRLLWLPTLVFRKTFSTMPPERALAPIGDQFLTSYLGTFGACMYFDEFLGAVRRENAFSTWSPLGTTEKELVRVKTWMAVSRFHAKAGNHQAVIDVLTKIAASPLDERAKSALIDDAFLSELSIAAAA